MVRRLLTCAVLLLTGAVMLDARLAVPAQTPTVDQILEKYVTAVGGRAALEKVTSINATGTIEIADANISGTVELFQKAPDKALTVLEFAGLGRQREGFDGAIGWADDPQNGLRQKSGGELAEAKRAAIFGRELKLKTVYPTMTVKGHEVVNGKDTYVVQAVPADGSPATLYFEVESGLMVRQLVSRAMPQGPLDVDVSFGDFRAVDGVKRPFSVRQATSLFTATITFSDIKQNVPIDDAMFKLPK